MTLIDQPPTGDSDTRGVVDRYEAQHDVMLAGLREAERSRNAKVSVLAEKAIGLGSQIAALQGRLASGPACG